MKKNIFITGGSGFLGRYLVKKLKEKFNVIDYPTSSEVNLIDYNQLKSISRKYDEIYHLAAWTQAGDFCLKNQGMQWIINQQINTNIIKWWQDNQTKAKFIFIGTSCCYSESGTFEEDNYLNDIPHPSLATYAMTKKMLTQGAISCQNQFGMKWFSAIPSTLYGTDYHLDSRQSHFIFDLIKKILRGKFLNEKVILWGNGEQRREIIHVEDFCKNLLHLNEKIDNQIINIGADKDYSIKEFANKICNIIDYDQNKIFYDSSKYTGALHKKLSIKKINKIIPSYQNSLTSIDSGLKELISWFVEMKLHTK
jgi:GDP-L-fucose synthase